MATICSGKEMSQLIPFLKYNGCMDNVLCYPFTCSPLKKNELHGLLYCGNCDIQVNIYSDHIIYIKVYCIFYNK